MSIRKIIADDSVRFPDGIVPPEYGDEYGGNSIDTPPPPPIKMPRPNRPDRPNGSGNVYTIALILALLAAAAYIISGAALMSSAHDAADRYIEQSKRKMRRMMQNIKNMPQWEEAKGLYKKILSTIVSKGLVNPDNASIKASYSMSNVDTVHMDAILAYADSIKADLPFMGSNRPMRPSMNHMGGPPRRQVQKTKVKVAIRILTVATGLIAVALQLFKTMSDWEDDDGMVELYHDTKGLLSSLRSGGGTGSILERAMRTEIYRTLRNTPGIGSIMPRGGRSII